MIVARVGGLSHPDADPANGNWGGSEAEGRDSALSLLDEAEWEILPDALCGRANGIVTGEELNGILAGVDRPTRCGWLPRFEHWPNRRRPIADSGSHLPR